MKYCIVDGCFKELKYRGYCHGHYSRWKRNGSITRKGSNTLNEGKNSLYQAHKLEYSSWRSMHNRCYNKAYKSYKNYGSRGIKVCLRWQGTEGFSYFISDMGKRPNSNYSLDRLNPNADYTPLNCRWSTITTQARNKRQTSNTKSRRRGVGYDKANNKWRAYIRLNGRLIQLGRYSDLKDAIMVRQKAELEYWQLQY